MEFTKNRRLGHPAQLHISLGNSGVEARRLGERGEGHFQLNVTTYSSLPGIEVRRGGEGWGRRVLKEACGLLHNTRE